jgi:hypothetical protein
LGVAARSPPPPEPDPVCPQTVDAPDDDVARARDVDLGRRGHAQGRLGPPGVLEGARRTIRLEDQSHGLPCELPQVEVDGHDPVGLDVNTRHGDGIGRVPLDDDPEVGGAVAGDGVGREPRLLGQPDVEGPPARRPGQQRFGRFPVHDEGPGPAARRGRSLPVATEDDRADAARRALLPHEPGEAEPQAKAMFSGRQAALGEAEGHVPAAHRDGDRADVDVVEEERGTLVRCDGLQEDRPRLEEGSLGADRERERRPDPLRPRQRRGLPFGRSEPGLAVPELGHARPTRPRRIEHRAVATNVGAPRLANEVHIDPRRITGRGCPRVGERSGVLCRG